MEEALHDTSLYCEFALLDTGSTRLPDETTILRFRHLLEKHNLSIQLMATKGLMLKAGTVLDATLIVAPSSTKNSHGERDPEMHQSKKGNQWHFGMKAHIGVDAESGLVNTVIGTAANDNVVTQRHAMLHGAEQVVFADAGYHGVTNRAEAKAVQWHVAMRPSKRRCLEKSSPRGNLFDKAEQLKASVRPRSDTRFGSCTAASRARPTSPHRPG